MRMNSEQFKLLKAGLEAMAVIIAGRDGSPAWKVGRLDGMVQDARKVLEG